MALMNFFIMVLNADVINTSKEQNPNSFLLLCYITLVNITHQYKMCYP